jgi:hypothetical protein
VLQAEARKWLNFQHSAEVRSNAGTDAGARRTAWMRFTPSKASTAIEWRLFGYFFAGEKVTNSQREREFENKRETDDRPSVRFAVWI